MGADTRAARREIDRALELAPDNAAARELSGDIYDREGQLNLAVGEWEAAAKAGESPALAEKIARGRREMATEEGMERESSRYFVVLYEREVPRELVQGFFKALDQAFDVLHDRLGEYPRDEITVILYARNAFKSITQAPDWSGGLYDGKIRVPVGGLTTMEEAIGLQAVLVHEMTHAFLYRMAPAGLPLWFNEGLATAFQGWDTGKITGLFFRTPAGGPRVAGRRRAGPAGPRRRRHGGLHGGPSRHRRTRGDAGFRSRAPHHRRRWRGHPPSRRSSGTRRAWKSPNSRTAGAAAFGDGGNVTNVTVVVEVPHLLFAQQGMEASP